MSADKANRRLQYLQAMGIQPWQLRRSVAAEAISAAQTPAGAVDAEPDEAVEAAKSRWSELRARVETCTACELHRSRTQTVFGVGACNASWMVIGEAPGASEDQQGEPFVGRAGQLLNEMLRAIGLQREEVFIANILKCRPPQNRDPAGAEVEACAGFLQSQVQWVNPEVILAVGRVAAQNLLKTDAPLGGLRGKVHRYGDIPLVVVYHPAYLLRSPLEKRKAWEDLCLAQQVISRQQADQIPRG